jgi:hypothetical protein
MPSAKWSTEVHGNVRFRSVLLLADLFLFGLGLDHVIINISLVGDLPLASAC